MKFNIHNSNINLQKKLKVTMGKTKCQRQTEDTRRVFLLTGYHRKQRMKYAKHGTMRYHYVHTTAPHFKRFKL